MQVFVTGATGVLGRPTVAGLVAAGHTVVAVARTGDKARVVEQLGARPVVVDLFDGDALQRAVTGCDAVLHLATSIPPLQRSRRRAAWAANDRLRTVTTRLLVDAARSHGVGTLVAESITFPYADRGDEWIDEDTPWGGGAWLGSIDDLEREVTRFAASGGRGVALRFGGFVGPEARVVEESLELARRGLAPVLGGPDAYLAPVHTDDAARATVAALGVPAGVYNVVADVPATRREYTDAFAAAFALRRRLRLLPPWMVRAAGGPAAPVLMRSQRVSNARYKEVAGWAPRFPDAAAIWEDAARRHTGGAT